MLSLDGAGRVIHASSFSKTVSPGVRVGYLAGPAEEIAKLAKRANETYISPNMLAESIVLELCRSGELDRNIAFVKGELKARCDALVAALREQIPEAEFVVPEGGYFLWLDLAAGTDTTALLQESKAGGATFVAGPDFMIDGGANSLRLSFAGAGRPDGRGRFPYRRGARARSRRLTRLGETPPPSRRRGGFTASAWDSLSRRQISPRLSAADTRKEASRPVSSRRAGRCRRPQRLAQPVRARRWGAREGDTGRGTNRRPATITASWRSLDHRRPRLARMLRRASDPGGSKTP